MSEPIRSPCRQICRLGDDRVCDGCGRTVEEIAGWLRLGAEGRDQVMERVMTWVPREPTTRP